MMETQVETGQLDMSVYLQQLREAIVQEKALSKQLKGRAGQACGALNAFKRAQIMQTECDEAQAALAGDA